MTLQGFERFLRNERRKQGRTLADVAEKAGFTTTNLSRMEMGHEKKGPTLETVIKLVEALGYEILIVKKL